ncbi:hypothetical protein BKA58DRAFT_431522 [Alternaria rosae]|uniref:uncharacterized protein n=1 Tax=Alternaria rosae TaxID=1187941 RepID=UPI001E8EA9A8|nr:uncharacterized protein BKA58DRAFT_431522 [Alternaria rosae]KAH6864950.1 hypothetical protein BKA58DRAFT_431522 [Alternaria rosae]
MRALRSSGKYFDFTITCGGDTHHVNKNIVCCRSGFFERAERFPAGRLTAESKVNLPEDDPAIVKLLIQFLYENDYETKDLTIKSDARVAKTLRASRSPSDFEFLFDFPHTCSGDCRYPFHAICPHHYCTNCAGTCVNFVCGICAPILGGTEINRAILLVHSKIYEIADKYDVNGLKDLARTKFSSLCALLWNGDVFAQAAEHALSSTPDSDDVLREVLCQTIISHIELLNKSDVAELLSKHTDFLFNALRLVAEEKAGLKPKAETAS